MFVINRQTIATVEQEMFCRVSEDFITLLCKPGLMMFLQLLFTNLDIQSLNQLKGVYLYFRNSTISTETLFAHLRGSTDYN